MTQAAKARRTPKVSARMSSLEQDALDVLKGLLASDSETVRLSAASAILQFGRATGDVGPAPTSPPGVESDHPAPPVLDLLRIRRLELVDPDGKLLAVMGSLDGHPSDPGGIDAGCGLALMDSEGRPEVRLCAHNHNSIVNMQGLTVYDRTGEFRVRAQANDGAGGFVVQKGTKGRLDLFVASSPIFQMFHQEDDERVRLEVQPGTGQPQLQLKDNTDVLFEAPDD